MREVFTCSHGHQWEPSTGLSTSAAASPAACPVCGERLMPQTSHGVSDEMQGTLAPSQMPPMVQTVQTATLASSVPPAERLMSSELPTIPGYEMLELLGRGGMGVVYKARQINLNRLVALKVILAGAHSSPQHLARFHLEAEAVASLQHPNIVQLYEVSEHNGCPYFSLEFIDGGSLSEKLRGRPQPPRPAARLVETLARAMHCAHQRGVIHRDLKPANILLQIADCRLQNEADPSANCNLQPAIPKIADFGLAKRLEDSRQTQTGDILGTPSYMAPEQAAGNPKEIGPHTDVYALGAILYELLTGRPPFGAKTPMETLQQVQSQEPAPLTRLGVKAPRDLEVICLKCLEKQPGKRYASAEDLADELHRFLAGEPIRARPVTSWERAAKWAKRRPALAALLLVSALSMLSLLAVSLFYNAQLRSALKVAEANFQRARRATDKVLTVVAEEHLADKPHMEEKQKELLEEALAIHQEFLSEKSDDPARQEETALAYKRMGDILHLLGKNDAAKDAYEQAIRLLTRLAEGVPATPEYRQNLANSYNFLGEALRTTGQHEESHQAYLQALKLQEKLASEFPEGPAYQQELARTLYNLGILSAEPSPKEAENYYSQAILTLEKLVRQLPDVAAYQQELARSYLDLGAVLGNTKRFQEANEANGKAITLLENLVKKSPTNREYKLELAVCCNNLGNSLRPMRRRAEAEKAHRKAVRTLEGLTTDFPQVPNYRSELANAYNSLGILLDDALRLPAAKGDWLAALSTYEKLVLEYPDIPDYQAELGRVHGNLGWLHYHPLRHESVVVEYFETLLQPAGLGRLLGRLGWLEFQRAELGEARFHLEEGIKHLKRALKSSLEKPDYADALRRQYLVLAETLDQLAQDADPARAAEDFYLAAGYFAQAVPLVEKNSRAAEPERKKKAKTYAEAALAKLRQALRHGYKDFDRLGTDPAFKSLHQHDDFVELLKAKTGASR
jgi:eukaryotic-like serine/threonine-protein kinase